MPPAGASWRWWNPDGRISSWCLDPFSSLMEKEAYGVGREDKKRKTLGIRIEHTGMPIIPFRMSLLEKNKISGKRGLSEAI